MTEQTEQTNVDEQAAAARPPKDPVRRWTFIILTLVVVLLAYYLRSDRVTPSTTQARVNAVVVPIAPEIAGTVTAVAVRNNQTVAAGAALFQIDTERYELAVQSAEANLEAAQQATGASEAGVSAARGSLTAARANMERARQDAIRMRNIRTEDPGAISLRRLESAEASLAASRGQVATAAANLEKAIQDLGAEGDDNSRIQEAQAALDHALLDLERSTVRAPEDGVVTGVRLDKGNYAATGAPQMTFIATHNIWLQADFTENNLGHIDPGDPAAIVFDVLPGQVIAGRVREVGFGVAVDSAPLGSLPTIENDTNWLRDAQRYPVLIDFELPAGGGQYRLKVGSQASVVIYTGDYAVFNKLAAYLIRLKSILTYAY
jgi:multidrug resistance efflux pump